MSIKTTQLTQDQLRIIETGSYYKNQLSEIEIKDKISLVKRVSETNLSDEQITIILNDNCFDVEMTCNAIFDGVTGDNFFRINNRKKKKKNLKNKDNSTELISSEKNDANILNETSNINKKNYKSKEKTLTKKNTTIKSSESMTSYSDEKETSFVNISDWLLGTNENSVSPSNLSSSQDNIFQTTFKNPKKKKSNQPKKVQSKTTTIPVEIIVNSQSNVSSHSKKSLNGITTTFDRSNPISNKNSETQDNSQPTKLENDFSEEFGVAASTWANFNKKQKQKDELSNSKISQQSIVKQFSDKLVLENDSLKKETNDSSSMVQSCSKQENLTLNSNKNCSAVEKKKHIVENSNELLKTKKDKNIKSSFEKKNRIIDSPNATILEKYKYPEKCTKKIFSQPVVMPISNTNNSHTLNLQFGLNSNWLNKKSEFSSNSCLLSYDIPETKQLNSSDPSVSSVSSSTQSPIQNKESKSISNSGTETLNHHSSTKNKKFPYYCNQTQNFPVNDQCRKLNPIPNQVQKKFKPQAYPSHTEQMSGSQHSINSCLHQMPYGLLYGTNVPYLMDPNGDIGMYYPHIQKPHNVYFDENSASYYDYRTTTTTDSEANLEMSHHSNVNGSSSVNKGYLMTNKGFPSSTESFLPCSNNPNTQSHSNHFSTYYDPQMQYSQFHHIPYFNNYSHSPNPNLTSFSNPNYEEFSPSNKIYQKNFPLNMNSNYGRSHFSQTRVLNSTSELQKTPEMYLGSSLTPLENNSRTISTHSTKGTKTTNQIAEHSEGRNFYGGSQQNNSSGYRWNRQSS